MDDITRVTVTDIEMRFGSMVTFIFKWALATIPAAILLGFFFLMIFILLGGSLAVLGGLLR